MLTLARPTGLARIFILPHRFSGPKSLRLDHPCLRPSLIRPQTRLANHQTCISSLASITEARKPKVVVITGPTAVGKTDVSLLIAEELNGEIISADSVQVYRGLDVGSAKVRHACMCELQR